MSVMGTADSWRYRALSCDGALDLRGDSCVFPGGIRRSTARRGPRWQDRHHPASRRPPKRLASCARSLGAVAFTRAERRLRLYIVGPTVSGLRVATRAAHAETRDTEADLVVLLRVAG